MMEIVKKKIEERDREVFGFTCCWVVAMAPQQHAGICATTLYT